MKPATRRPSLDDHDTRARNGGTSTPAGASVWDIEPASAAGGSGPGAVTATPSGQTTQPLTTPRASVSSASTSTGGSGMVDGAVATSGAVGGAEVAARAMRHATSSDLFVDVSLPEASAAVVVAALEPDRPVPTPVVDAEPEAKAGAHAAPNTVLGIDRRLVLLLLLVLTMAMASWFFVGGGPGEISTAAEDVPEQFDTASPEDAADGAGVPLAVPTPAAPGDEAIVDQGGAVAAAPPLTGGDEPGSESAPVMDLDVTGNDEPEQPSVAEPAPVLLPVTEPVVEDVTEPVVEDVTEPVVEDVTEPVVEDVTEPVVEDDGAAVTITTALPADGRRVEIVKKIESCRFANACLVAGFELIGFDSLPGEFVCEFGGGARYTFDLPSTRVAVACATSSRGSSITIEVDGVRSDPIVFD